MKKAARLLAGVLIVSMMAFLGVSTLDKPGKASGGWTYSGNGTFNGFVISYTYTMYINAMNNYSCETSSAVIVDYTGSAADLVIPATITVPYVRPPSLSQEEEDVYRERARIKGYTFPTTVACQVSEIAPEAFADCPSLTSVLLQTPYNYVKIDDLAFFGCTNLEYFETPTTINAQGSNIFGGCTSLKSVAINNPGSQYADAEKWQSLLFAEVPSIETVTLDPLITELGDGVFAGCSGLKTIVLSTNMTKIGASAFSGCSSLRAIALPPKITGIADSTFSGCSSLLSVTIPANVTSIGVSAFKNCRALTAVVVPPKVGQIGSSAFYGCSALHKLTLPTGAVMLGSNMLTGCNVLTEVEITTGGQSSAWNGSLFQNNQTVQTVTFIQGVTGIAAQAFYGCTSLADIVLPDSVTVIGRWAFEGTQWLADQPAMAYAGSIAYRYKGTPPAISGGAVSVRSGTTGVAEGAFADCAGLKSVTLPMGLNRLEDFAFTGCIDLAAVTLPTGVSYYGSGIFENCGKLTSVTITNNPAKTAWASTVFQGNPTITTLTFGSGITSTGASTFSNCKKLATVNLPGSLSAIGASAFSGCSAIRSISLPGSLTTISEHAFDGCSSLTSLVVPTGVTTVGDFALSNCTTLGSLTVSTSLSSLGSNILTGSGLRNVTIAKGTSSGWSNGLLAYNTAISSVTFADSITSIGRKAFSGCANLSSVHLPSALTTLGMAAFYGCTNLTSITLPATLVNFGPQDDFNKEIGTKFTVYHTFHTEGVKEWWTSAPSVMVIESDSSSFCQLKAVGVGSCTLNVSTTYYEEVYENGKKVLKERVVPSSWLFTVYGKIFGNSGLTKIYGYAGSAAEGYARSNNFTFSPVGAAQKVNITNCTVSSVASQTYTGAAIRPGLTVKYGGMTLKAGTDYSLTYTNNTKAGTATVTITGLGDYTGTKAITFAIVPKSVTGLTVSAIATQYYSGAAIQPGVTIKLGTITLKAGTDYALTYVNNTKLGTATVTITGKGNYTGTRKVTFAIAAKPLSALALTAIPAKAYTGSAIKPAVTLMNGTRTLILNTDYTVSYANNTSIGVATVTITGKGNYTGTRKTTFTIVPRQVTALATASRTMTSIKLSWTKLSEATGYEVYVYDSVAKKYVLLKTIATNTSSLSLSSLKAGKAYTYRVRAYKTVGTAKYFGAYSATLYSATLPATPTVTVTAGKSQASVTWKAIAGVAGYEVYMATSSTGTYTKIAAISSSTTARYTKTGLTKGKTYYFKARSYFVVNGVKVYSGYSAVKSVKVS